MNSKYLDATKMSWARAGEFSPDKEATYPDHGIVQEFDKHRGKHVLEYGMGGGSDTMSFLRRGNHVDAVDVTPANLEATQKRLDAFGFDPTTYTLRLLENSIPLPYANDTFDIVSSHGVVHHIKDLAPDVVKEFARVLKPGGLCYMMLYTEVLWEHHQRQIAQYMEQHHIDQFEAFCWCTDGPGTPYARSYNVTEAANLIEGAGLRILDYTYWLHDFFNTLKSTK